MTQTKYDVDLEGFFDLHIFYPVSELFMPIFKIFSFTPNLITTLSLITISFAIYYLFINTKIAAIFMIIAYIFDCCDGMFARKYNMTSALGMAYDYTKDGIMNTIFYFALLIRYTSFYDLNFWMTFPITLVIVYLAFTSLTINEALLYYKKYKETDYYSHLEKQFKRRNLGIILFLNISKFFYILVKPYIKNPGTMLSYSKALSLFRSGNIVIFLFTILNIFAIK